MVFCIFVRLKIFLADTKPDLCLYAFLNFCIVCNWVMLKILKMSSAPLCFRFFLSKRNSSSCNSLYEESEKHFIFLTNVIHSPLFCSLLLVVERFSLAFLQTTKNFSLPLSNLILLFQLGSNQLCIYTRQTIWELLKLKKLIIF